MLVDGPNRAALQGPECSPMAQPSGHRTPPHDTGI
jgi:hypothetical protein